MPPIGYFDFLALLKHCRLVLTDSGGIQEESCILGTPCVTLRNETERQQTIDLAANILAKNDGSGLVTCINHMIKNKKRFTQPFGDGHASERIVDKLLKHIITKERANDI